MGVNTNETLNIDLVVEFVSNLLTELLFFAPFHVTPEEFENGALFLRLGLPSTLILHKNGAYQKRSSKRRYLKTLALYFVWTGKILGTITSQ